MLTEGVHYEECEMAGGRFVYDEQGKPLGYCYEGIARWLRKTHPDITVDDLAQLGRHKHNLRRARNKRLDISQRKD